MKLCTCNKCGGIFEDMNPQVGAKDYEAIQVEQLVKLHNEDADYGGYWGCPNCNTDAYLSDTVDAIEISRIKEGITWILTDADTGQYGRRLSTYKFEFKEDEKPVSLIDLELYTWKEICDACESYYENMDELFRIYGNQSSWIIAECLFETDNIK